MGYSTGMPVVYVGGGDAGAEPAQPVPGTAVLVVWAGETRAFVADTYGTTYGVKVSDLVPGVDLTPEPEPEAPKVMRDEWAEEYLAHLPTDLLLEGTAVSFAHHEFSPARLGRFVRWAENGKCVVKSDGGIFHLVPAATVRRAV